MSFKYSQNNDSNNVFIIELKKVKENKEIVIQILKELDLKERYISYFKLEYFQKLIKTKN